MGIVFRHAEGLINIGINAFAEMGEHGIVSRLLILTHHNSGIQSLTRRIGAESGSNLHADLP